MSIFSNIRAASIALSLACAVVAVPTETWAKKLTEEEKLVKKDDQKIESFTKKINETQQFLDNEAIGSAITANERATKFYGDISASGQARPEVVDLKKKYDAQVVIIEKARQSAVAEGEQDAKITTAKLDWTSYVDRNGWVSDLSRGKEKDIGNLTLSELEKLKSEWPEIEKAVVEFHERFDILLAKEPTHHTRGTTVGDVAEIIENRIAYRNQLVDLVCRNHLMNFKNKTAEVLAQVNTDGIVMDHWVNDLYGAEAQATPSNVASVQPLYQWIGQSVPAEALKGADDYKPGLRKAIEKKAAATTVGADKFTQQQDGMKALINGMAERRNLTVLRFGATKSASWKVIKNALGIPLYRTMPGTVVFKKKGEPFARAYSVEFTSPYDGKKYTTISEGKLSDYMTLVKN